MHSGLLAVHAHPDDETLFTGALLAVWAAAGRPVTVVTCTRGEQGEVIGADMAHLAGDGPALAAHRETELAAALAALGVRDHAFLDTLPTHDRGHAGEVRYGDSGMAWLGEGQAGSASLLPPGAFVGVPVDSAAARLAALIRDRRPEVVVGYEPGGGYGHPDHVHAHRVMHRAVEMAAAAGVRVPVVLWSVAPEPGLRAARAALASVDPRPGLTVPDPAGPLPSAAVPEDLVDVRVDVAPVLGRVLAALAAHPSQVQVVTTARVTGPLLGAYALSNDVLLPLLDTESYRCAPGWPPSPVAWPAGVRARVA